MDFGTATCIPVGAEFHGFVWFFFSLTSIVLTPTRVFWEKLQCVKSVDFSGATRPNSVQLLVNISNIYMFTQYKNNNMKKKNEHTWPFLFTILCSLEFPKISWKPSSAAVTWASLFGRENPPTPSPSSRGRRLGRTKQMPIALTFCLAFTSRKRRHTSSLHGFAMFFAVSKLPFGPTSANSCR